MFCPQCGQQQVSDAVRFCSRCGFQLGGVSAMLASGGVLLPSSTAQVGTLLESSRRKGMRQGGIMLLFAIFLMPMFAILHELLGTPDKLPLIGVLFFIGGLLRLIYALAFEEGPVRRKNQHVQFAYAPPSAPGQFGAQGRGAGELPPVQTTPAQSYFPPRANTSEIGYQPSVTESTTRLLDEQRDSSARGEK
ncbi:MAG: hypothetical protein LC802_14505 [Acidobacteria bacterium]|nr:hypothetical protein [Acidobacteriota bacterium]